jgi:lysophospholipase L1-like esterase
LRPYRPFGPLAWLVLVTAILLPGVPAAARSGCDTLPRTCAAVAAGHPLVVVAIGSSSTAGAGATAPDKAYPAQLEAALVRRLSPHVPVRVVNKGVNGNDIDEMAARIDADVLALSPTLVVWQVGSNDVIRGMPPSRFAAVLRAGAERIRSAGIDLVLMDMQSAPVIDTKADTPAYLAAIATVAAETGAVLLARHRLMRSLEGKGPPLLVDDGLHMSDAGYGALAGAALELLPLDR